MASLSADQHVRVEDYLNDKIQSQADLDSLDTLLESVKQQQDLLRKQLQDAEAAHRAARDASSAHSASTLHKAKAFQTKQASIEKRMMVITQSEASDDAVKKFDSTMQKLRRLDLAKEYVELLSQVEALTAEARRNFEASPEAALKPYIRLQDLASDLRRARPDAEDAAPHLMHHVDAAVQDLRKVMTDSFSADFETTLQKMKWPPKDSKSGVHFGAELAQSWAVGVERLLRLQGPELKQREADASAGHKDPIVLLPLEIMVKPLALRFKYHFSGDRPTNRRDKPEFFLSHIADLLNAHEIFFADNLQPILYTHFKTSPLAFNSVYIDSASALITALLPMLREKLRELVPAVSRDPQLLSHLIHELMSFDASLRDTWGYDGGNGAQGWPGVTSEILQEWFPRWLEVEKEFALKRYHDIIEQADSGEIDYESVDSGETKPTKAAMRVNDLLETITDRYRPLVSFSHKMRFLIDIQLAIFDAYHGRLAAALEAFLTITSTIGRTVQGVSKDEAAQLKGLGGIERLARIFVSADYLERKMRDWSDDIFFLELWDELQFRARAKEKRTSTVAGALTVADIAGRTSSGVGSDEDTGALFDETAATYHRLRVRTEGIMQERIFWSIRTALRTYKADEPWASLSAADKTSSTTVSAGLDATVQTLSSHLAFLAKCLAFAPLRRVSRQLGLQMQEWLWDNIVEVNSFSSSGLAQLGRDVHALWDVFDQYCRQGYGRSSMPRLADALVLMALPIADDNDDDDNDNDNDNDNEEGAGEDETVPSRVSGGGLSLREAEQRIFRSNEEARQVLEELGLDHLLEADARTLVTKRVELGK